MIANTMAFVIVVVVNASGCRSHRGHCGDVAVVSILVYINCC